MVILSYSTREIAEEVDYAQQTISDKVKDFDRISTLEPKLLKSANFDDFTPQIYNIWRKAAKTNEVEHFGTFQC